MEASPPPPPMPPPRTLTELDEDSLAHCATFLDQGDVLSLALTCRQLRRVAHSDSIWSHLFRVRWPYLSIYPGARVREAYLKRHASLQQFKFIDPVEIVSPVVRLPPSHVMLNRDDIFLAQGSSIQALKIDISGLDLHVSETYRSHSARITSMRAKLWDIRFPRETEPIADLEGHGGNVSMLHMDPYKIVTGGLYDLSVNVWETDTGMLANNLPCLPLDDEVGDLGLTGLAVDGQRILTVCLGQSSSLIHFRDFYCASTPIPLGKREVSSKFWEDYSRE